MVQVINTGNPRSKISEMLGLSLGQGLSNGINSFYANKALENVLNDSKMSNSSFSEKMGALQKALSPYGEIGQNILNQRLQVEAQDYKERQAKIQAQQAKEKEERLYAHQKSLEGLKAANQGTLEDKKHQNRASLEDIKFGQRQNLEENKSYRNAQIKEGEQGRLFEHQKGLQTQKDVAAGERQQGLFGHQTGLQTQKDIAAGSRQNALFGHQTGLKTHEYGLKENLQEKKSKLPLNALQESTKALNEAKINQLNEENKLLGQIFNASPDVKSGAYQKAGGEGIENIQQLGDDRLRQLAGFRGKSGLKGILGNIAQNELDIREANKKEAREDKREERKQFETEREYHSKISRPVIEAANERLKQSDVSKGLREQLKRDISSGNTSGFFPYMVDRLGLESFRNPESARFSNEIKNLFIGSLNEIPGARPNQFLERLLSTAQPLIGRSPEANLSVMDVADFVEDVRDEQARLELQVAKEDNKALGYVKDDVVQRARERMGDYVNRKQEDMAMKIRERHEKEMDDAALINELVGGKVTPGSYVTPRMMQILYLKNNKDMKKAIDDAQKYGLKFPEYLE
jgi:hypothetical protein